MVQHSVGYLLMILSLFFTCIVIAFIIQYIQISKMQKRIKGKKIQRRRK